MQTRYKEDSFFNDGGKILEHVAQRDVRCFIPASVQVGQGSDQPDQTDVSLL